MKIYTLYNWVLILVLSSCATPNVLVDVMKKYPSVPVDSVKVFAADEWVPNSAENLGRIIVTDGSFSSEYAQAVELAKEHTAQYGGNGLILDYHKESALGSSTCPSVSGQMLRLKDNRVDTLAYNPIMEARKENQAWHEELRRRMLPPRHTVSLKGGYSWCVDDLYSKGEKLNPWGMSDWQVIYNFSSRSGWGVSGVYTGFYRHDESHRVKLNVYTILPALSYTLRHDRWLFRVAAGAGAGWVKQNNLHDFRVVGYSAISAEYMITPHWGVNLSTSAFSFYKSKDEIRKFQNIGLEGGVQWYF